MKIPLSSHLFSGVSWRALACVGLLVTTTVADDRDRQVREEPRPKFLSRVGNFFYNFSHGIERSEVTVYSIRYESDVNFSRVPASQRSARGEGQPDLGGPRYIAPVNPDPRLLHPREPVPTRSVVVVPRQEAPGIYYRPTPPPDSLKPVDALSVRTVPLPEPRVPDKKKIPAESYTSDVDLKPKINAENPAPEKSTESAYPVGTSINRLGRVKSPYPPYRELDVTGLPSGSLAKDPQTGKIFRVP